jgi:pyruvate dehydrogenase E2 component (dihydrolipoamide acetyltransferase)
MDTPHGLVAPVLRRPDQMSLAEISAALKELRHRAHSDSLQHHELINAPFAVTNLGMFNIDFFSAFVFHGQTAVLSVGRMTSAADGTWTAWFGLALDHRVVDGAEGARFLQTLQAEILKA